MATVTKLPSGKWRALVRLVGHETRSASFKSKSEANKWAADVEAKLKHIKHYGAAPPPKNSTFGDFLAVYTEEVGSKKEFGRNKRSVLNKLVKELGKVKMGHLTEHTLREFAQRRINEGAGGVTISADLSYISAVLRWIRVAKRYDVDVGMARNVRAGLPVMGVSTRGARRSRIASEDEISRIVATYKERRKQQIDMPTVITFALETAMRQSEITGLRIEDLNLKDKTVLIRDRKDPREKKGNDQIVPLLPGAMEIIKRVVGDRQSGKIFNYDSRSVSTSFTRITTQLGIENLRFHDLRHTAITRLFKMGLTVDRVAVMSGHKSWEMLRRYTHLGAQDVHDDYERLMKRQA